MNQIDVHGNPNSSQTQRQLQTSLDLLESKYESLLATKKALELELDETNSTVERLQTKIKHLVRKHNIELHVAVQHTSKKWEREKKKLESKLNQLADRLPGGLHTLAVIEQEMQQNQSGGNGSLINSISVGENAGSGGSGAGLSSLMGTNLSNHINESESDDILQKFQKADIHNLNNTNSNSQNLLLTKTLEKLKESKHLLKESKYEATADNSEEQSTSAFDEIIANNTTLQNLIKSEVDGQMKEILLSKHNNVNNLSKEFHLDVNDPLANSISVETQDLNVGNVHGTQTQNHDSVQKQLAELRKTDHTNSLSNNEVQNKMITNKPSTLSTPNRTTSSTTTRLPLSTGPAVSKSLRGAAAAANAAMSSLATPSGKKSSTNNSNNLFPSSDQKSALKVPQNTPHIKYTVGNTGMRF